MKEFTVLIAQSGNPRSCTIEYTARMYSDQSFDYNTNYHGSNEEIAFNNLIEKIYPDENSLIDFNRRFFVRVKELDDGRFLLYVPNTGFRSEHVYIKNAFANLMRQIKSFKDNVDELIGKYKEDFKGLAIQKRYTIELLEIIDDSFRAVYCNPPGYVVTHANGASAKDALNNLIDKILPNKENRQVSYEENLYYFKDLAKQTLNKDNEVRTTVYLLELGKLDNGDIKVTVTDSITRDITRGDETIRKLIEHIRSDSNRSKQRYIYYTDEFVDGSKCIAYSHDYKIGVSGKFLSEVTDGLLKRIMLCEQGKDVIGNEYSTITKFGIEESSFKNSLFNKENYMMDTLLTCKFSK